MKGIEEIIFTEREIKAIGKNEEIKNLAIILVSNIGLASIVAVLIAKGITSEDEFAGILEEVSKSDDVRPVIENIKRLAVVLEQI